MKTRFYSEVRKEIKTGDLIAYGAIKIHSFTDLLLYLYRKIFKVDYVHVGIAVVIANEVFIIEAQPPVVRIIPLKCNGNFYVVFTKMVDNDKYINFLFNYIGKKYGLFYFIKRKLNLARDNDVLYCSELCSDFYNNFGFIDNDEAGQTPDSIVSTMLKAVNSTAPTYVKIDKGNL